MPFPELEDSREYMEFSPAGMYTVQEANRQRYAATQVIYQKRVKYFRVSWDSNSKRCRPNTLQHGNPWVEYDPVITAYRKSTALAGVDFDRNIYVRAKSSHAVNLRKKTGWSPRSPRGGSYEHHLFKTGQSFTERSGELAQNAQYEGDEIIRTNFVVSELYPKLFHLRKK